MIGYILALPEVGYNRALPGRTLPAGKLTKAGSLRFINKHLILIV
jgi:hypothetical protein